MRAVSFEEMMLAWPLACWWCCASFYANGMPLVELGQHQLAPLCQYVCLHWGKAHAMLLPARIPVHQAVINREIITSTQINDILTYSSIICRAIRLCWHHSVGDLHLLPRSQLWNHREGCVVVLVLPHLFK